MSSHSKPVRPIEIFGISHFDAQNVFGRRLDAHLNTLNSQEDCSMLLRAALPGHDFSALLAEPEKANVTAVRPAVLFNYVGPSTLDADFLRASMEDLVFRRPSAPLSQAKLDKRGFLSFVFDGRSKFARYYAPNAFNTPRTIEEILGNNDVQLFDLQNDPEEVRNLALEPERNREQILRINALLNDLIAKEVGVMMAAFLRLSLVRNDDAAASIRTRTFVAETSAD